MAVWVVAMGGGRGRIEHSEHSGERERSEVLLRRFFTTLICNPRCRSVMQEDSGSQGGSLVRAFAKIAISRFHTTFITSPWEACGTSCEGERRGPSHHYLPGGFLRIKSLRKKGYR